MAHTGQIRTSIVSEKRHLNVCFADVGGFIRRENGLPSTVTYTPSRNSMWATELDQLFVGVLQDLTP